MTLAQKLLNAIEDTSVTNLYESINFVDFLKQKEPTANKYLIDSLISEYDEALTALATQLTLPCKKDY